MKHLVAYVASLAVIGLISWGVAVKVSTPPDRFNWAIQGELSHRNCDTQPGTHPWFINTDPEHQFFMGCQRQTSVGRFTILPGTDPGAPPPTDTFDDLLKVLRPTSTSEWHRFNKMDDAGMYAAARLERCSHYYECSGFIVVDPKGKFAVSPVRTDYESDNVRVEDDMAPSDWKVVADFHSHPCIKHHYTGLFSREDMIGALSSRHTAYMVDMCTGDVHKFIPGLSRVDVTPVDDGSEYLSPGNIIGHVPAYKDDPTAQEGL